MKALILFLLLVAIGDARADNKAEAKKLVDKADLAYKLGKFDEAFVDYERAYQLFHAPGLLFNMAQCQRNSKNYEKAVFLYESYLREAQPNPQDRAVVDDLVRESRAALEKQKADAEAAQKADAEAKQKALEAARIAAEAAAERERLERERLERERLAALNTGKPVTPPPPGKPIYTKWWFWTVVGGAALAVGGGVAYATASTTLVPPSGSVGGLDRR
jgi:tetratricopeptide (TPR) repeat protein